jgi:hypothetical protein
MDLSFSSKQDWSNILVPYIKNLFKETGLCYFGHAIHEASNNFTWVTTNTEWAEVYWLGGLYSTEPIVKDIHTITKQNGNCVALWDCYNSNQHQQDIMQIRMDICRMKKGFTIGKQFGKDIHYVTVGWQDMQSCNDNLETKIPCLLQKYVTPIWILHNQLLEEQKLSEGTK